MALTFTNITSGFSDTDAASYATASVSPAANRLYLLAVANSRSGGGTQPTVTGAGLTWAIEDTVVVGTRRVSIFRALGASPIAEALTIDMGGVTQTACAWVLDEVQGIDTGGTNGSGAVIQSVTNTALAAAGLTVTLAAFGDAVNNGAYGAFAHSSNAGITPGSGFDELADVNATAPSIRLATEKRTGEDTSVDAAAASGTPDWAGIALEIKAAAGAATYTPRATLTGVG